MAKFKLVRKAAKLDDVAEPYRGAYVEKDGAYELDLEKLEAVEFDDKAELSGALERERRERREAKEALDKLKDIDPEEYRRLKQEAQELESSKLKAEGKFDELKSKWDEQKARELGERDTKITDLTAKLRKFTLEDKVRQAAIKAGVIPEDIDDVMAITARRFDLDEKDRILVLDDDGDQMDVTPDKYFSEIFKTQKPKFYAASGAGGSGAPAGGNGGGSGGAKTIKRADLEKMAPADAAAHFKAGGTVVD